MKKTNRGFNIFTEFKDTYKNTIRVQQSSSAMTNAVWIFTDSTGPSFEKCPENSSAPHLNKTQAKRLIKALQKFVGEK